MPKLHTMMIWGGIATPIVHFFRGTVTGMPFLYMFITCFFIFLAGFFRWQFGSWRNFAVALTAVLILPVITLASMGICVGIIYMLAHGVSP